MFQGSKVYKIHIWLHRYFISLTVNIIQDGGIIIMLYDLSLSIAQHLKMRTINHDQQSISIILQTLLSTMPKRTLHKKRESLRM